MNRKIKSILATTLAAFVALPAVAALPMEQPLPDAASPSRLVDGTQRKPKSTGAAPRPVSAAASEADPSISRDLAIIFAPSVLPDGKLTTPERSPAANGCPVSLKAFGQGRYLVNGLFTDFTLATAKPLMAQIKALSRSTKKSAPVAKAIIDKMKKGTIDAGYYQIYLTVDAGGGVTVDLIKRIFLLPDGEPGGNVKLSAVKPGEIDTSKEESILAAPVKAVVPAADAPSGQYDPSDQFSKGSDKVGYAPEGLGPKWAALPAAAPDFHLMPEPVAIGRDAVATPNLTPEQRVTAREFGDGPLAAYARALGGNGDVQAATEKVVSAAQSSSLFINPGALTKAILDLTSAVKWEGRPGQEGTAVAERNERVAEAVAAANRQLSTAGIYLEVAVSPLSKARTAAYFLRGKHSVQVLGTKDYYDLRQVSGPIGWYGFYITKLDVGADLVEPGKAFGNQLAAYLATEIKSGELVSRPNGLANTVQAAWGIETLVRRYYGRRIPTGEEFGAMWTDGLLLHQAFNSFFRKNGGAEKAVRMTNEQTARAVGEQAAFLYQLSKMDPRMVHVALCVMADRCYRLEATNPVAQGARRMFDNFQTESGIQLVDASGKLRMEGLRDLMALDADKIQQMAAESLVREIIRIYLPGTY